MAQKAASPTMHDGQQMTNKQLAAQPEEYQAQALEHLVSSGQYVERAAARRWLKRGRDLLAKEGTRSQSADTFQQGLAKIMARGHTPEEMRRLRDAGHVTVRSHVRVPGTAETTYNRSDLVPIKGLEAYIDNISDLAGQEIDVHHRRVNDKGEVETHTVSGWRTNRGDPFKGLETVTPKIRRDREKYGRPLQTETVTPGSQLPFKVPSISGPMGTDSGVETAKQRVRETAAALDAARTRAAGEARSELGLMDFASTLGVPEPPVHPGRNASSTELDWYRTALQSHQAAVKKARDEIYRRGGIPFETVSRTDEEGNKFEVPVLERDPNSPNRVRPVTDAETIQKAASGQYTEEETERGKLGRLANTANLLRASHKYSNHPELKSAHEAHQKALAVLAREQRKSRRVAVTAGTLRSIGRSSTPVEDMESGADVDAQDLASQDVPENVIDAAQSTEESTMTPKSPTFGLQFSDLQEEPAEEPEQEAEKKPEEKPVSKEEEIKKVLASGEGKSHLTPVQPENKVGSARVNVRGRKSGSVAPDPLPTYTDLKRSEMLGHMKQTATRGPALALPASYQAAHMLHGIAQSALTGDPVHARAALTSSGYSMNMDPQVHEATKGLDAESRVEALSSHALDKLANHPVFGALMNGSSLHEIAQQHGINVGTGSLEDVASGAKAHMDALKSKQLAGQVGVDVRSLQHRGSDEIAPGQRIATEVGNEDTRGKYTNALHGHIQDAISDITSGISRARKPWSGAGALPRTMTGYIDLGRSKAPGGGTLSTQKAKREETPEPVEKGGKLGPHVVEGLFGIPLGTKPEDIPVEVHKQWELVPENERRGPDYLLQENSRNQEPRAANSQSEITNKGTRQLVEQIGSDASHPIHKQGAPVGQYRHEIARRLLVESGREGEDPASVAIRPRTVNTPTRISDFAPGVSTVSARSLRGNRTRGGMPYMPMIRTEGGNAPSRALPTKAPAVEAASTSAESVRQSRAAAADRQIAAKFHGVPEHQLTPEQVRSGVEGAKSAAAPVGTPSAGYRAVSQALEETGSMGSRDYARMQRYAARGGIMRGEVQAAPEQPGAPRMAPRPETPVTRRSPAEQPALEETIRVGTGKRNPTARAVESEETLQERNARIQNLRIKPQEERSSNPTEIGHNARIININRNRRKPR